MFPGLESLIHCGLGQNSEDLQDFLAVLFAASDNSGQCCVLKFEVELRDLVDWDSLSCRSDSSKFVSEEGFDEGKGFSYLLVGKLEMMRLT